MQLALVNSAVDRRWVALVALLALTATLLMVGRVAGPGGMVGVSSSDEVANAPLPAVAPVELLDIPPDDARAANARRPFSGAPLVAAPALVDRRSEQDRLRAVDCLAAAAWYEAGDDAVGERTVIQTVLNRARHPAFPRQVCGVVFQGSERTTGCQFTFTCDGALRRTPSPAAWARAQTLARDALAGAVDRQVGLATHYHTDWVLPVWSAKLEKISKVRTHIFFRWPGGWGERSVLREWLAPGEPQIPALGRISKVHFSSATEALIAAGDADPATRALDPVRFVDRRVSALPGNSDDVFFVALDAGRPAGSHAISAVNLCGKRPRCLVLGWMDHGQVSKELPLSQAAVSALDFVYRRTGSGEDAAYWNCDRTPRENAAQCLPSRVVEVRTLVNRP